MTEPQLRREPLEARVATYCSDIWPCVQVWGFLQQGVPFGGPHNKDCNILGLHLGPFISGNSHIPWTLDILCYAGLELFFFGMSICRVSLDVCRLSFVSMRVCDIHYAEAGSCLMESV